MTLTDAELYEGFSQEQIERYEREARAMYDPALVEESHRRIRKMTKAQWQALGQKGGKVARLLAGMMNRQPGDAQVQQAIARHRAWIEHFFSAPADVYSGLGRGFAEHPEFRAFYDKFAPGLADFLNKAIAYYCERSL